MGYKFNNVKKSFEDKNCQLLTTEEEFNEIQKEISEFNKKSNFKIRKFPKFEYIASCGCQNIVYYNVFLNRGTGTLCPNCTKIKNSNTKKEENIGIINIKTEFDCIQYFTELVKNNFIIKKNFDGCKSDISYKPINITDDLFCGIQVKTTNRLNRDYNFNLDNKYDNLLILCISLIDKRMWIIPYEKVNNIKKITIGLKKSKYNIYELTKDNINEKLNELYLITNKYNFEILDIPVCIYQLREKEYRIFREEKIDFIKFENNEMEGQVFDFKGNNKKIQEKVGGFSNYKKSYSFELCKSNGKINGKISSKSYEIGDNDIYWLNCEGKKYFYVIPEKILIEKKYIGNYNKKVLLCNPLDNTKWYNEYLYYYDNINKEKLMINFI